MTSSRTLSPRLPFLRPTLTRLLSLSAVVAAASLVTVGLAAAPAQAASTAIAPSYAASVAAAEAPSLYRATDPVRLLDGIALGAGQSRVVDVSSAPTGATSVWLNVTASRSPSGAAVAVCAAEVGVAECLSRPTLTAMAKEAASSPVRVTLGPSKKIVVAASASSTVYVDRSGFLINADSATAKDSRYQAVKTVSAAHDLQIGERETKTVTIPNVPNGATAVAVNIVSNGFSSSSYVAACPAGQSTSACANTSALNPVSGSDREKFAIVKLGGTDRKQIDLYNNVGTGRLDVDVLGFFREAAAAPEDGIMQATTASVPADAAVAKSGASVALPLSGVKAGTRAVLVKFDVAGQWRDTAISAAIGSSSKTVVMNAYRGATSTNTVLLPVPAGSDKITVSTSDASVRVSGTVLGEVADPASTSNPAPTPTPTPTPTPAVPDAANTGVPAGTALKVHDGDLVITTPGTVVDGLDIRGTVSVRADNVTIKNSVVRGKPLTYTTAMISNTKGNTGLRIIDTEIFPSQPSPYAMGIIGKNFTATRVDIHGVIDGIHLVGGNVTVEGSWLHDNLHYASDPNHGGQPSHDDSVQIQAGSNIRFAGNNISGATNSGIQITQDAGIVSNLTFERNLLDGGGCTINIAEKGKGPIAGVVINDNTFGRSTKIADCAVISPVTTVPSLARNYYTPDHTLVTVRRG